MSFFDMSPGGAGSRSRLAGVSILSVGALLISSLSAAPTKERAPESGKSPAPASPVEEETVQLAAMNVTAEVGRYSEPTTAAATKLSVDFLDLPFTVNALNAAFLDDVRAPNLGDAYPYISGLNSAGNGAVTFSLRGFSATAAGGGPIISLQFDGLLGTASRTGSPPTADVERLEVIKGPASVFYGQANPGGLINFVIKKPKAERAASFETYFSTYAGQTSSFGDKFSWTGVLDSTGPIDAEKHWLYRLVMSYQHTESFRDYLFNHNLYIYPSLTYRWNPHTWLTVKVDYLRENRRGDEGLAVPYKSAALLPPINVSYQPPNDTQPEQGNALSTEFHDELANRWELHVGTRSVWHRDHRYNGILSSGQVVVNGTPYTASTVTPIFRNSLSGRRSNYLDAWIAGRCGPDIFSHKLMFGVNGGKEWIEQYTINNGPSTNIPLNLYQSNPNPPAVFPSATASSASDPKGTYWNYGVYVSDQIQLGQRWVASLGLRHEEQDASQTDIFTGRNFKVVAVKDIVPSFGLVFHPAAGLSLYANYVEGFKPQGLGNVSANGDPRFPTQTSSEIEVGIKYDIFDHKLSGSLCAYDLKKKNVLETTGQTTARGLPIANLSGLQENKGTELELAYQPVPHWEMRMTYTYMDARVKNSVSAASRGALLDNAPHNSGSLWTRYNLPRDTLKGLGFGAGVIYVGKREGIITNVPANYFDVPGYTRIDFGIYLRRLHSNYALNVENVFDRTYIAGVNPGSFSQIIPGGPRKVTLSRKMDF